MAKRVFMMDEHTGTHVDVPFHFDPDGPTMDKMPVEKFIGEAKLLDVSDRGQEEVTGSDDRSCDVSTTHSGQIGGYHPVKDDEIAMGLAGLFRLEVDGEICGREAG